MNHRIRKECFKLLCNMYSILMILHLIDAHNYEMRAAADLSWKKLYGLVSNQPKRSFSVLRGDSLCLTCQLDHATYMAMYTSNDLNNASLQHKPVSITWFGDVSSTLKLIYCKNDTKPNNELPLLIDGNKRVDYECMHGNICLKNVDYFYPTQYECAIRSFVYSIKLDIISNKLSLDFFSLLS